MKDFNYLLITTFQCGTKYMSIYTLSLYVPGSKTPIKWLYESLDEALNVAICPNASRQLDFSIYSDGIVVYEMFCNPRFLPEDLFD